MKMQKETLGAGWPAAVPPKPYKTTVAAAHNPIITARNQFYAACLAMNKSKVRERFAKNRPTGTATEAPPKYTGSTTTSEAETGETPPAMRPWMVPKLKENARP
jgi:hypothetical protein